MGTTMRKRGRGRCRSAVALAVASLASLALVPSGHAATTIAVTTTSTAVATDAACSLPEAMQAAEANATVNECTVGGGGAPFTITLPAGAITLTSPGDVDAYRGPAAFGIYANDVEIVGNAAGSTLTVSGAMRHFSVDARSLTLRRLALTGGNASNGSYPAGQWGGAVLGTQAAVVNLDEVTATGNSAAVEGAVASVLEATLNVRRSTFAANTVPVDGSTIRLDVATANVANSTVAGSPHGIIVSGSTANVSSSTIAVGSSLAILSDGDATLELRNSLLGSECSLGGTVTAANNSGPGSCSVSRAAPTLLALASNGGTTQTLLPVLPTTSRDTGVTCTYRSTGTNPLFTDAATVSTDQRGVARDSSCDAGAVELKVDLTQSSLGDGTVGTAYSEALSGSGGTGPYTFGVGSGGIPGVTVSGAGPLAGTPTAAGAQALTLTATDANGIVGARGYAITVAQGAQAITGFATAPSSPTYASGTFTASATGGGSGSPVTFASVTPAVCTTGGTNGATVAIVSAGTCTLHVDQAGTADYTAASQLVRNVTIAKATQTIGGISASFATERAFTLTATGLTSGNPVTFASQTPAVCTSSGPNGQEITVIATGLCTVAADQAGDGNHHAAAQRTFELTIEVAPQAITGFLAAPATVVYAPGATFAVAALGGASGNAVTFASRTPATCTSGGTNGATITVQSAGVCELSADQAAGPLDLAAPQATLSVTIERAGQAIAGPTAPTSVTYAPGGTFAVTATGGGSGNPVTFRSLTPGSCTSGGENGATVSVLSAGRCVIAADQAGDANHTAAPQASAEIAIARAAQRIAGRVRSGKARAAAGVTLRVAFTRGRSIAALLTGGGSGNPVTLATRTPKVCAAGGRRARRIAILRPGTCVVVASQAGSTSYEPAPDLTQRILIRRPA